MNWQDIETAPRDGTPILIQHRMTSNDVHGYVPWTTINVVIAWWDADNGWEACFMYDGAADSMGMSSQFFQSLPEAAVRKWMPLPSVD